MNFSGAKPKPQVLCSPGRFASKGASAHGAEFVAPPRCQDETQTRHFATWLQSRGLAYRYRLYPNQQVWPAIQPNFKSLLGLLLFSFSFSASVVSSVSSKTGCFQRWMLLPSTLHLGVPAPNCPNVRGSIMDQIVLSWRHPALFIYSSEVQRATGMSISRLMVTGYRIDFAAFQLFWHFFCGKGAIVGWQ